MLFLDKQLNWPLKWSFLDYDFKILPHYKKLYRLLELRTEFKWKTLHIFINILQK